MDLNSNLSINGQTIDVYLNSLTKKELEEVKEFTGDEKNTI